MSRTTPATLALRKVGCAFKLHTYVYDSSAESTGLQYDATGFLKEASAN